MARELIQLGTSPTGSDGDTARAAFTKVNAMTGELYAASDLAAAKLATIAEDATANATDAQLRDRATHTGTQAISTVSGLQVALDGKQPSNANLTAFSGLTGTADRLPYFTGAGALALADYTAVARTFDAAATVATQRAALGLVKQTSVTDTTAGSLVIQGGTNLIATDTVAIGYTTGSGGTVTQATNKSTAVTLNKQTGQIITSDAALAANTAVYFQLNNTSIGANDNVTVTIKSNSGSVSNYQVNSAGQSAGSCYVVLRNTIAVSLSDAVILQFTVIKGAMA